VETFKGLYDAAAESARISRLTESTIKSTGGAANITAKQVGDLATAISNKTGADDEAIQSGENLLLTFTNVRNEVGKGNDIFNQATQLALDMSTALGTDMSSASMQLGKALNDPIKGITALSRAGVSFTAEQKDQIKTLVESGNTMDAQKIILSELARSSAAPPRPPRRRWTRWSPGSGTSPRRPAVT
jgi:phage-related minor tail protein